MIDIRGIDLKKYSFYKNNSNDRVFWIDNPDVIGEFLFSFDKKTIFNLFEDYPYNLTTDQKTVFDAENPYWAEFFSDRK